MNMKIKERSWVTTALTTFFTVLIVYGLYYFFNRKSKPINIKDVKTLTVGTSADFPPFSFLENHEIVGFDIDVAKEVLKRIGKDYILKDMPFKILIPQLQIGTIHLIAAGMTPTKERAKRVYFSQPYLEGDPLIVISLSSNPPITRLEDLNDKEVIVNDGHTAERFMENVKGPILRRLKTPAEAFLALRSASAHAYVTARAAVKRFFDKYGHEEFSVYVIPNTSESTALVISKKYPALVPMVKDAIEQMKKDGTIENLKQKWKLS